MAEPLANRRSERTSGDDDSAEEQTHSDPAGSLTDATDGAAGSGAPRRRRRGSRGGRNRGRGTQAQGTQAQGTPAGRAADDGGDDRRPDELPEPITQGRVRDPDVAERVLVRRPQIGDTRPAPDADESSRGGGRGGGGGRGRRDGGGGAASRGQGGRGTQGEAAQQGGRSDGAAPSKGAKRSGRRRGRGRGGRGAGAQVQPVQAGAALPVDLDESDLAARRGRERKGRPVGRYLMAVSVRDKVTQIAVLEGRNLIEHYVSRPADDVFQIHGNIYLGRVQNVLPGMEAAFVDIGTPKNAVLYRGDVQYDAEDIEQKGANPRIEQLLKAKQTIICQVTKNPIAHKGARLTQEVSLPGRFVVLVPNSSTYGISKRLADDERKRLRQILEGVRPEGHGLIVRTAAENVTAEEIERDVRTLVEQWGRIEKLAERATPGSLLYREPDMALRVIREEFNADYRGVVIDDPDLYEEVRGYVAAISPGLADRVQYFDAGAEPLSLFEHHHVHEQLHKALDRMVWLPSGGSLIIEHTEALTVIDVNTGKNVGSSSLEETVFRNNLEAANEIAKQLRLRDIGGIIVIDFIDMEIRENREAVIKTFRDALARDKTRTQVFDISDLGLVEMTRKRIGEGLLESVSQVCPECEGRGIAIETELLD